MFTIVSSLLLGSLMFSSVSAQTQSGGVDKEGSWYAGEGLKQGDFFSYRMCHVDYKECTEFDLDMWIKGDKQVGSETKWLAEVVVYDGGKITVGEMELGKIAPEPTGGSEDLGVYRGAFKSSVVWLSAFATSDGSSGGKEGPKDFSAVSWGKIANIGGEQILPTLIEDVTVPAGTWEDSVQITWKTGGATSRVWIVDDFPFPVKAHTFTHVSSGIPPPEYNFELREYRENVQESPFGGIISTPGYELADYCDTNFERDISIKKPTNNFDYQIHLFYGPEDPIQGCEMKFLIKFLNKFSDTEFLNQVQFDVWVVDDNMYRERSIAEEEGRQFLYSPSGQYILDMIVKEDPGTANYVIWVYGLAPEGIVPPTADDFLIVNIPIFAGDESSVPVTTPVIETSTEIPSWIKNNAGWWAEGAIDDGSFVQGIQFLIKEGIVQIPPTSQGTSAGSNEIPSWIKNNAGWWAEGAIDDGSFVQGIQFLIKEGIMSIPS